MDGRRFDELARSLSAGASRRRVLKGLVGGAGLVLVGAARSDRRAAAQDAKKAGDACTTGTRNPCGTTSLVCCPTTARAGGPGVCTDAERGCMPDTGVGATAGAAGREWLGPLALLGGAAALVAARLRRVAKAE